MSDLPHILQQASFEPHPSIIQQAECVRDQGASLAKNREQTELVCITEALHRHKNNRLKAAADLGISRMTLYKKLHKYGLL